MTTKEEHREDLANMIDDFPQAFTYAGEDFIGTRTPIGKRNTLEDGGYMNEFDVFVIVGNEKRVGPGPDGRQVWNATFTGETPQVGQLLTMDDQSFRIERITPDELNVGIKIDLETDQK